MKVLQGLLSRGLLCQSVVLLSLSHGTAARLQAAQEAVPHALGEQRVAVFVAGVPGLPVSTSVAELRDIFFSHPTRSLNSYVREVSYGKSWVSGDVFGPYSLSRVYGWENNEWNEALAETLKLAGGSVDLRNYNNVVLIYPVQWLTTGWAGNAGHGCVIEGYCPSEHGPTVIFLGASSTPTLRDGVYGVALHEFLHNLGSGHADTLSFAPQTVGIPDPRRSGVWVNDYVVNTETIDGGLFADGGDVLSAPMGGNTACTGVTGAHLSAPMKYHLGWVDKGANLVEVEAPGAFHLAPLETATGAPQALRIRRLPGSDPWLWVEYRQPVGVDQSLSSCAPETFSGALIYYEDPPLTDTTLAVPPCPLGGRLCGLVGLLDFTADTTPGDFRDAALTAGSTWKDPYGPLTIQLGPATGAGIDVSVSYDTPCATFSPTSRDHGRQSDTGTIAVTAPDSCHWSATAYKAPNWLSITSGSAGSGSGTVAYSLAANDTYHLRNGWITVSRQVFPLTQDYEKVAPMGTRSDPNTGRSAIGAASDPAFDFYYLDRNGGDDIRQAFLLFSDQPDPRNACEVEYDAVTKRYRVANDAGTGWSEWSQPWGVGQWPNPGNSQCEVRFAAPAGPGGDEFYTSFHFFFKTPLVGTKNLYLKAVDAAGIASDWVKVGTWTIYVNQPPAVVSVSPSSGSGTGQTFDYVFRDPNGSIDLYDVRSAIGATSDAPRCYVALMTESSKVYLESDAGGWQTGVVAGSPKVLQNQACAVDVSGVTFGTSGTDLALRLPLVFNAGFEGAKTIYGFATDKTYVSSGFQPMGTWTIPHSKCTHSLDPPAFDFGPDETRGSVQVSTQAGCGWLASGDSWITITAGRSGTGNGTVAFTALTNAYTSPRTGAISVGGQTVVVRQSGRGTPLGAASFGNVLDAGTFEPLARFPPATWITVVGTNLAPLTRVWNESDFSGNKLPTALNGVSVTFDDKPAYINYISPTQINLLTPDDDGSATWNMRIITPAGPTPYTYGMNKAMYAPTFFRFDPEGRKYLAARHQDGSILAKPGLFAGLTTSAAKPEETVMLFATGFGPTNPPSPAGELVVAPVPTTDTVTVRIGGQKAEVPFAGLVSSGLYQLNVLVPPTMADGDQLVVAEIGGVKTQSNAYLTVNK